MLLQIINIISGFILGAPKLREFGATRELVEKGENFLRPYQQIVGWITLVIGIIGLLDRIDIFPIFDMLDGDSYPQAIPAILIGLLLLSNHFSKYPKLHGLIMKLEPYKIWIGIWGILAGLVSIIFGCPVC